jgi:hypothetical protein
MFEVGDIVRCILPDAAYILVSNQHYIITQVLTEFDDDGADSVDTPLVLVSVLPALTPIGQGFFITRFVRV